MKRNFKNLREECRFFGVRMQSISEQLKMTQPYVSQVLAGSRQNSAITGLCLELLHKRKNDLKEKLINDIRTTQQNPKDEGNWNIRRTNSDGEESLQDQSGIMEREDWSVRGI
jgi:hypothetical protein